MGFRGKGFLGFRFGGMDCDAVSDGDACYVLTQGTLNQDPTRGWHLLKSHRYGFWMVGRKSGGKKGPSCFEKHGHLEAWSSIIDLLCKCRKGKDTEGRQKKYQLLCTYQWRIKKVK